MNEQLFKVRIVQIGGLFISLIFSNVYHMNKQLFYVRVVQLIFILFLSFITIKVITQIDNNLYEYNFYNEDGSIHQKGTYIKSEDGEYLPHSYWSDDVGTKAFV